MIWNDEISFEGFSKKINDWYDGKNFELCDPPIDAQYALDLIFKTLIDDKENYPYLTTNPESTKQTNSIMLDLILKKYSRKYRKYLKSINKSNWITVLFGENYMSGKEILEELKQEDYELWIHTQGYSHLSEEQWEWLISEFVKRR